MLQSVGVKLAVDITILIKELQNFKKNQDFLVVFFLNLFFYKQC